MRIPFYRFFYPVTWRLALWVRQRIAGLQLAVMEWEAILPRASFRARFLIRAARFLPWLRIQACRVQQDCTSWVRIQLDF